MPAVPAPLEKSVLAVLAQAKASGVNRLGRTALFKFVYLLDCLHAESHEGKTASEARWYFHHFGPYAVDLANGIDELEKRSVIQSFSSNHRDKDTTQYWLGEYPIGPSLSEVGLTPMQAATFSLWLRQLSNDLSKLLNHVYFRTSPMQHATPGTTIDFKVLNREVAAASHSRTHIKDHGRLMRILQLRESLKNSHQQRRPEDLINEIHRPIYDDVYQTSMAAMDEDEQLEAPINFSARLI